MTCQNSLIISNLICPAVSLNIPIPYNNYIFCHILCLHMLRFTHMLSEAYCFN